MSAACPLFGFDVLIVPAGPADADSLAALRERFLAGVVESEGLSARMDVANPWRHTITRDGSQATEADRSAIAAWAAHQPDMARCEVGPLVDLSPSA